MPGGPGRTGDHHVPTLDGDLDYVESARLGPVTDEIYEVEHHKPSNPGPLSQDWAGEEPKIKIVEGIGAFFKRPNGCGRLIHFTG